MITNTFKLKIPERIGRLDELAYNIWWSWHLRARALFRALDYPLWRSSGHSPVKVLTDTGADNLENAANDPFYVALYDSVISAFDADLRSPELWFARHFPGEFPGPIAYFSMEYALHNSLPIYAGGLGILAGDRSIMPRFSASRMVKEYSRKMYGQISRDIAEGMMS